MTRNDGARGVLKRRCADGKTPLLAAPCASRPGPATMAACRRIPLQAPDRPSPPAHPARLILILSLAPTVGLGIGRFAYSLVLPDMRDTLGWSYSAAGFMNTINAAGYLAGALVAARLIKRFGLSATVRWSTLACVLSLALCAHVGQFRRLELCAAAGRRRRGACLRRPAPRLAATIAQSRPAAGELSAEPVLRRTRARHPGLRPDRALRAAGVRAGLVVDRVVGDDAALGRHDHSAAAGADRYERRHRRCGAGELRDPADADLSRRLFPVRRRLHRLHDLHDRLCPRRRRRRRGAERVLEPDRH